MQLFLLMLPSVSWSIAAKRFGLMETTLDAVDSLSIRLWDASLLQRLERKSWRSSGRKFLPRCCTNMPEIT
ncbi:hypothetical protein D3C74_468700 [compost metagenome]